MKIPDHHPRQLLAGIAFNPLRAYALRRKAVGIGEKSLLSGGQIMRLTTMTMRGLMVASAVVAFALSVALSAEGAIILVAFLVFIRAVRGPHPAHLTTTILLTLLTGILLWANLRPSVWQEVWGGFDTPTELDPITKAMFWRGWPLSPFMICIDGLKYRHVNISFIALVFDGALFLVALFTTKVVCEGCLRRRRSTKLLKQRNSDQCDSS